jgi:signal transduction histidine kinase
MKFPLFIITFIFIFFHLELSAQPVISLEEDDMGFIGQKISFLKDDSEKLGIKEVIPSKRFILNKNKVFSPFPEPAAFWIRFNVINSSGKNYYLEIDNPPIRQLDIYSVVHGKISLLYHFDEESHFFEKSIKVNDIILPLHLASNDTTSFYIRYRAISMYHLPIRIAIPDQIIEISNSNYLMFGIFYGIFFVAICYNFFLFVTMRDRSYLLYVGLVFFISLYFSWSIGHLYQLFYPAYPNLNQYIYLVLASIIGLLHLSFIRKFLNTKERTSRWDKWAFVLQMIYISYIVLMFINPYWASLASGIGSLITIFYPIIIGYLIYNSGYDPARFYLVAYVGNFVCVITYVLKGLGIFPYSFFTNNILFIGFGLEAILLSFALGDRYKTLRKEREEAQKKLNFELEAKIFERNNANKELEKVNNNLVQINSDLDNFIYIASHNLRGPVSSIEGLVNVLDMDLYKPEEFKSILEMMRTSIDKFKNTIYDLTEISRLQKIYSKEDVVPNNVIEQIDSTKDDLKDLIKSSEVEMLVSIPKFASIKFSKLNFKRIIYNLLTNSLKFRSPIRKLKIEITMMEDADYWILIFSDNGIGINKNNIPGIFSMFKKAHEFSTGQGVGLYIVKRALENEGGKIEVESEEGMGTSFKLFFRK